MDEGFIGLFAVAAIFIALPWLIFHYVTKWKQAKVLTGDDEKLLDDLYEAARRLGDRLETIERIMAAENPEWRRNVPRIERGAEASLLDKIDALENDALTGSRKNVK